MTSARRHRGDLSERQGRLALAPLSPGPSCKFMHKYLRFVVRHAESICTNVRRLVINGDPIHKFRVIVYGLRKKIRFRGGAFTTQLRLGQRRCRGMPAYREVGEAGVRSLWLRGTTWWERGRICAAKTSAREGAIASVPHVQASSRNHSCQRTSVYQGVATFWPPPC